MAYATVAVAVQLCTHICFYSAGTVVLASKKAAFPLQERAGCSDGHILRMQEVVELSHFCIVIRVRLGCHGDEHDLMLASPKV